MSKLSVAIVGLPNVGKSTLFNALLRKQQAYAANFPFATIEPNVGIVPVPDERLGQLAEVISQSHPEFSSGSILKQVQNDELGGRPPEVPATVEFVDIAGLIAGAHKGEGLGNKFLSHIRQTDAICHVVRAFESEDIIRHESVSIDPGSGNNNHSSNVGMTRPVEDFKIIETELALADLATIENQPNFAKATLGKKASDPEYVRAQAIEKIRALLEKGEPARNADLTEEEMKQAKQLSLLTMKPILIALNVSEGDLGNAEGLERKYAEEFGVGFDQVIAISAKVEEELSALSEEESKEYLRDLGLDKSGLERLIQKSFTTLGLMTFLTAGEKEVRAWTIKNGSTAPEAAGAIHTDFENKFIKADVVSFKDFVENGGWKVNREKGKVRQEGKEYVMQEGDVIEFKIGS